MYVKICKVVKSLLYCSALFINLIYRTAETLLKNKFERTFEVWNTVGCGA